MLENPPGGGDEPPGTPPPDREEWRDLLDQVEAALEEAGVLGRATREALRGALGEALEHLQDLDGVDIHIDLDQADDDDATDTGEGGVPGPEVTVVDGGRSRHEPRSPRPRPDLRVAPGTRPADGAPPADGEEDTRPFRLHLVRRSPSAARPLEQEGRIALAPDEGQALYRGALPRLYRVACVEGHLTVLLDGEEVETLREGQTLDVEGTAVTARSADGRPARGLYTWLA